MPALFLIMILSLHYIYIDLIILSYSDNPNNDCKTTEIYIHNMRAQKHKISDYSLEHLTIC